MKWVGNGGHFSKPRTSDRRTIGVGWEAVPHLISTWGARHVERNGRRRRTRQRAIGKLLIASALLIGSVLAADASAREADRAIAPHMPITTTRGLSVASPQSVLTTRTVNTISDTDDGSCGATCSLRDAIKYSVAGDTINFLALFNTPQTIKLTAALPIITKNLTITGPGKIALRHSIGKRIG
jgi:CSLREA domain-containing protein